MKILPVFCLTTLLIFIGCNADRTDEENGSIFVVIDSIFHPRDRKLTADDIRLKKDIRFEDYHLEDEYPYEDTVRIFQWEKIKNKIAHLENAATDGGNWGVFSNYRNKNGEAPTVQNFVRNDYGRVSDQYDVERYQSVPLYNFEGDTILDRYGRDGWLVKIIGSDTTDMVHVQGVSFEGEFLIPNRYLLSWGDSIVFDKIAVVDITNQNIATLEKQNNIWNIISMNPATTGVRNPPYHFDTPVGIFAVQEQKEKMYYLKGGSSEIAGFAPYASRFTNGAYIHGIPVQYPRKTIIEYSPSLGTTPRSQMCVRNASSHSKFVYDWVTVKEAVVIVID